MDTKTSYHIIGLMSGTSLDGLDIAHISFQKKDNKWLYELLNAETILYSPEYAFKIKNIGNLSALEYAIMHQQFGKFCADEVNKFKIKYHCKPELISSHGQTIFHNPEQGYTSQIGCGATIASITNITTICDFRTTDVAHGGQGAPLVPIADKYLFSEYDACINLGGFANISFDYNNERIAFDICAVNTVLNYLANMINIACDYNGVIAKSGIVNASLLNELNSLEYINKLPPKSLGYEWLNEILLPILDSCHDSIENKLATFSEHIAQSISTIIDKYVPLKKILITGGGAYNTYLIDLLTKKSNAEIIVGSKQLIEFKEAIAFGFLGLLRFLEIPNTLKSVTGAKTDSIGGCIYLAK